MLAVISPAKTLDFETPPITSASSVPDFLDQSQHLIERLRSYSEEQLASLMSISPKLAALNCQRYEDWHLPFSAGNARQAILAFKGDVYTGFTLDQYTAEDFKYAQKHLRILSGLYGLLRPLDFIQPYRLEMGTKLATDTGKDLYAFWKTRLGHAVHGAIQASGGKVLVNLASQEYFQALDPKDLKARVINPVFKDQKNGQFKIISFHAKKARGCMSDYIIRNQVREPEGLKGFQGMGYRFNAALSGEDTWVFTRSEGVSGH
jgi:uncharacterized protein